MARIVVFSLCLLLTVPSITCIDCYRCISTDSPDCLHPEKRLERKKCDTDGLIATKDYAGTLSSDFSKFYEFTNMDKVIPLNCLKQVTLVEGKEIVFRGCQLPRDPQSQLDVCKKVFDNQNGNKVQVTHCSLCDTDGCNGAPRLPVAPLAALGALLVALAAAAF